MEIIGLVFSLVLLALAWMTVTLLTTLAAGGLGRVVRERCSLFNILPQFDSNHTAVSCILLVVTTIAMLGVVMIVHSAVPSAWTEHKLFPAVVQMIAASAGLPIGCFASGLFMKP